MTKIRRDNKTSKIKMGKIQTLIKYEILFKEEDPKYKNIKYN